MGSNPEAWASDKDDSPVDGVDRVEVSDMGNGSEGWCGRW